MGGISAHDLRMEFDGFAAVADVGFEVATGEFITLLGPSGCGKTTLLRMISGFLAPTAGTIHLAGEDVTRTPPEKRDTALCFQSYALFPHLTVRENLEFGLRQKRVPPADRETRLEAVVGALDLSPHLAKLPNQLSGGQQQRVALGRALVMRPSVILFDEPLSNLDARLRDQVRIEIRRIQRDFGLTAIYVTHDQAEALAMSDRVFVMKGGRIEQSDTPERLYGRPRTSFVADFIGNANVLEAEVRTVDGNGLVQLDTALGPLLAASTIPPQGSRIRVCWRPEDADLAATGPNLLSGRVTHRAFQGHFTDLHLETGATGCRIQTKQPGIQEGDTITFSLKPEQIVLLEAVA
ncbi:ABC transporter ATP-binding protein [Roseibium marinum]|uniref:ABC-type Fe3+/spermidine/putrescine transport system ATPase subunit n=1 Tax=Roseibium marinum TaxID=281252 RepID=A0A2S3USJ4_9HYPH|nr:ABC transporter ATP-binding protein [Roseibium marinum]POF30540.1 ABC-type Fe3+/spermidine/putrescine transport system ATPase subunit [Roseibium marinum]